MKNFFTKNGILLLAAITIIAVGMCVASALSSGTGILHNAIGVVTSPFRTAGSAVSNWAEGLGDRFTSVSDLQDENEELRKQIADLEADVRQAKSDAEENERLRKLLGLRQQRRDLKFESAYITERSSSNWSSTLTLGKGTNYGVAIGDCVVDAYGNVVGVITDAGLNWSTVTTVLDTDSKLGAVVFRTDEIAVAVGDLALMDKNQLKLDYLQSDSKLINGDLIVTSGLGGYYPAGLVIGSVDELRTDDSGLMHYAVVSPKTELSELREVFVITDFDVVE